MRRKKSTLKLLNIILKKNSTMDMDQRESTDGCLNYEGVPIDGFSHFYAGDIETILKVLLQDKLPLNMKMNSL